MLIGEEVGGCALFRFAEDNWIDDYQRITCRAFTLLEYLQGDSNDGDINVEQSQS